MEKMIQEYGYIKLLDKSRFGCPQDINEAKK